MSVARPFAATAAGGGTNEGVNQMTRRWLIAALALLSLAADALAQDKGAAATKGGPVEAVLGLVCLAVLGLVCVAATGGGVYGLVWYLRWRAARVRRRDQGAFESAFEEGVRGAVGDAVAEAMDRHRRAKP
jgi:hypothetical protein